MLSKKHLKIKDKEISNIVDEYLNFINIKREEFELKFEKGEKDYRKKEVDNFL